MTKSWNIRIQPVKKLTKKEVEDLRVKVGLVWSHAKRTFEEASDFDVKLKNNRHTMEIGFRIKKLADVTLEEHDD